MAHEWIMRLAHLKIASQMNRKNFCIYLKKFGKVYSSLKYNLILSKFIFLPRQLNEFVQIQIFQSIVISKYS